MWKLAIPLLVLVLGVGAAVVSDGPGGRADLRIINRGDVTTLDLHQMSWLQDFRVARMLWEGLVRNDVFSRDYRVEGAAAESWEESEGGRVWTFRLRAGAAWSDGTAVTADDFVYSWRRLLLPDTLGDYAQFLNVIRGAEGFAAWRARATAALAADRTIGDRARAAQELWQETEERFAREVGVRAVDARTLRVELTRPVAYFLEMMAFPATYPVQRKLLEAYTTIDADTGLVKVDPEWTKPGRLVTNGPMKLAAWRFKRDMRLERNEHYWNPAACNVRSILLPVIEDGNAQVLAFTTGAVDWVSDVVPGYRGEMVAAKRAYYAEHREAYEALRAEGLDPVEIDRRLPADPRQNIHSLPAFGTYFLNFNCRATLNNGRPNPLADARVRRALALAVDKGAIAERVRRIGEAEARTLIPPGSIAGYESPAGLGYDPEAARRLLAEAGYGGGAGLPEIEYLFNKDGGHDLIAQAVARDWERKLGVRVRLMQREIKVFRDDLKSGAFMVARGSWFGDFGDPVTFLEFNRTGDGNNDRKYSSARYDGLLERAAEERDKATRMGLLREAERIVTEEDVPVLCIFHYNNVYLFDPHRLTGISSHARGEQLMYRADVLGDGVGADKPLVMTGGE